MKLRYFYIPFFFINSCSCDPLVGERCEEGTSARCEEDTLVTCEASFVIYKDCEGFCDPQDKICSACGDGVLSIGEACDDGNLQDNDDCDASCQLTCGAGFGADGVAQDEESGHCYVGFTESLNWFGAESRCEEMGGYLTVISSSPENSLARAAALEDATPWIGHNDLLLEDADDGVGGDDFVGVNGEASFTNFSPGEPSNIGPNGEDCVQFLAGSSSWNDSDCNAPVNGYLCEIEPDPCGDNILHSSLGEGCDDGEQTNGDGCDQNCQIEPGCGNNILDAGEACEDGNLLDGDLCESDCTIPFCGNSVVDELSLGEKCDDGDTLPGDGCNQLCQQERCGNGVIDLSEGCDDQNLINGDGCEHDCTLPFCGNGFLDPGEQCDDGNNEDTDGCGASCNDEDPLINCGNAGIEAGELCPFEGPVFLPAGPVPGAIESSDLNLDGFPDLVVTNRGQQGSVNGSVITFIQGPGRTFTPTTPLEVGPVVQGIVVADFNVDGFPDFSWTQFISNQPGSLEIFSNDGFGGISPDPAGRIAQLSLGREPAIHVSADFDGDSIADLANVSGQDLSTLRVFFGADILQGGVTSSQFGAMGSNVFAIDTGDINGDGRIDIVTAGDGPTGIKLFLNGNNNTAGDFSESSLSNAGIGTQEVILARLDAGPTLDIITRNEELFSAGLDALTIYLGNGDGTFVLSAPILIANRSNSIQVLDLNRDGHNDIITQHTDDNFLSVRRGPSFSVAQDISPIEGSSLHIADIDLDGVLDLALVEGGLPTGQVVLYFGTR